jgi:hypothetical protein
LHVVNGEAGCRTHLVEMHAGVSNDGRTSNFVQFVSIAPGDATERLHAGTVPVFAQATAFTFH